MSIRKKLKVTVISVFSLIMLTFCIILYLSKDDINATPETIDNRLSSFFNKDKMGGFAVAVFTKDSILYSSGYGYSSLEKNTPYTTQTSQYIASISKTTIGVSLLKAQELGLINIDDPINKHLPFEVNNPNYPNESITIRHLATHTSSMDYNEFVIESLYIKEALKNKSLKPFMDNYFVNDSFGDVLFTNNAPGENWNYSNIGAALASYIIEYCSGMTYSDFTSKYIFEPLAMTDTYWFESQADSTQLTTYYEPLEGGGVKSVKSSGIVLYPVRDVLTNLENLTSYGQAMLRKDSRVLSKDSYTQMFAKQLSSSTENQVVDNQGIFWMIDRNQYGVNYQLTGYNGGDFCINTMLWFDPETEIGYIFMGNTGKSKENASNHILIYNALASYGDYMMLNDSEKSFAEKFSYRWHNIYSRINGIF